MQLEIRERSVGDVVILEMFGKITIGEGSVQLRDAVGNLLGHRRVGLALYDYQKRRRPTETAQPPEEDQRPAHDHEAADSLRDLRGRTGGSRQLSITPERDEGRLGDGATGRRGDDDNNAVPPSPSRPVLPSPPQTSSPTLRISSSALLRRTTPGRIL
jgi:hypothetical protein